MEILMLLVNSVGAEASDWRLGARVAEMCAAYCAAGSASPLGTDSPGSGSEFATSGAKRKCITKLLPTTCNSLAARFRASPTLSISNKMANACRARSARSRSLKSTETESASICGSESSQMRMSRASRNSCAAAGARFSTSRAMAGGRSVIENRPRSSTDNSELAA